MIDTAAPSTRVNVQTPSFAALQARVEKERAARARRAAGIETRTVRDLSAQVTERMWAAETVRGF